MQKLVAIVLISTAMAAGAANASIIYESATPVVASTTGDTSISGLPIDSSFFQAANFQITTPTLITGIGGHFSGTGTIFGAILATTSLTAPAGFPFSNQFGSDVLADTVITLPGSASATATLIGSLNV
jgi:hypothetical protein